MQQQVLKFPQDVKIPLAGMHAYSKIEAAATCRLESPCSSPNSAYSRAKSGVDDSDCGAKLGAENSHCGFHTSVISSKTTVMAEERCKALEGLFMKCK